jgi:hypothetical protein
MALKATLASKAEYEALAEPVRALYVEKDGKYALDVDDAEKVDLKTKLAEFRDNNRTMHGELEKLRPLQAKFEGVDPEEYKSLKEEVAAMKKKGVKDPSDIDGIVKAAVAAAVKPLQDEIASERTKRDEAQKAADAGKFRELVSADATKAGVAPSAVRHVLREAELVFALKDGQLAPREGVKHPTDPLKEMTPSDWLGQLAKTDAYLFEASNGGGSRPGSKPDGSHPGAKRLINPTAEEMGQHVDALAKGEMTIVRT